MEIAQQSVSSTEVGSRNWIENELASNFIHDQFASRGNCVSANHLAMAMDDLDA
jgi:hypothetical protein